VCLNAVPTKVTSPRRNVTLSPARVSSPEHRQISYSPKRSPQERTTGSSSNSIQEKSRQKELRHTSNVKFPIRSRSLTRAKISPSNESTQNTAASKPASKIPISDKTSNDSFQSTSNSAKISPNIDSTILPPEKEMAITQVSESKSVHFVSPVHHVLNISESTTPNTSLTTTPDRNATALNPLLLSVKEELQVASSESMVENSSSQVGGSSFESLDAPISDASLCSRQSLPSTLRRKKNSLAKELEIAESNKRKHLL